METTDIRRVLLAAQEKGIPQEDELPLAFDGIDESRSARFGITFDEAVEYIRHMAKVSGGFENQGDGTPLLHGLEVLRRQTNLVKKNGGGIRGGMEPVDQQFTYRRGPRGACIIDGRQTRGLLTSPEDYEFTVCPDDRRNPRALKRIKDMVRDLVAKEEKAPAEAPVTPVPEERRAA